MVLLPAREGVLLGRDAGAAPLEGARAPLAGLADREHPDAVGAGHRGEIGEAAADLVVHGFRRQRQEAAGELRDPRLEVELVAQRLLAALALGDVAQHRDHAARSARDREHPGGRLHRHPRPVAVSGPVDRGAGALGALGRGVLPDQRRMIRRVDEVGEAQARQLLARVAHQLGEARARVQELTVGGELADRVLGVLGERAEALFALAQREVAAHALERAGEQIGDHPQPGDLVRRTSCFSLRMQWKPSRPTRRSPICTGTLR